MVDKKVLMILAIVAVGLFAMPNILAAYAGTHTLEYGKTDDTGGAAKALDCTNCHMYIYTSAISSNQSAATYGKHLAASTNVNYTTYLRMYGTNYTTNVTKLINSGKLNESGNYSAYDAFFIVGNARGDTVKNGVAARVISNKEWHGINTTTGLQLNSSGKKANEVYPDANWGACLLCHQAPKGTHSRLEVKGCTNARCHGSAGVESYATGIYGGNALKVGNTLDNDRDAHSSWYNRSAEEHDVVTAGGEGSTESKDYYTCLGCHSHADMNLEITKATGFNATLTTDAIEYVVSENTTNLTSSKIGGAFSTY